MAVGCSGGGGTRDGGAPDGGGVSDGAPNVLFVLTDDQRDDTLACMPKLADRIARQGLRFARSYATTALCCPSRTSILTGQYARNHGVRNNGGEVDEENFGGAGLFVELENQEHTIARWLHRAGYRTGFFGKFLNGYDELDGYVPPDWDVWSSPFDTEHNYYDFVMVQKALGEDAAERVCYLPTPSFDPEEDQRCREGADRVVDDGGENYEADIVGGQAAEFVRQAAGDRVPFFAYVAFKAPHAPFVSSRRYQPDPTVFEYSQAALDALADCPLWDWADRPASYLQTDDLDEQPLWVQARKAAYELGTLDAVLAVDELDRKRHAQLASLLAVDDEVDELFAALDEAGVLDDTVVVFTSDNGYAWGEHYWNAKNCDTEACARVPLAVFGPGVAGGGTTDWLAGNIDHAPTIADLAGVDVPGSAGVDGVSYRALLEGREPPARDSLLLECWSSHFTRAIGGPDFQAAVVSDWKYVEHYEDDGMTTLRQRPDGDPDVDLYDLARDPSEAQNLSHLSNARLRGLGYVPSAVAARRADLAARLQSLRAR